MYDIGPALAAGFSMHELDMAEADLEPGGEAGEPGGGDHVHAHPHQHPDGSIGGEMHSHGHDHDGVGGGRGEYGNVKLSNDFGSLDMTGLDPSPDELAAVLDAAAEADEEGWAEEQALDAWAAGLSDEEIAQLEHEAALDGYGSGPDLANDPDTGYDAYELAGESQASLIDAALASMTDREHERQVQDAAERGHRRASTEVRLSNALGRLGAGSYLYGQQPAELANALDGPGWADGQFSTGPVTGPADVRAELAYQLRGGLAPGRARRQPMPPVGGLAARIGLK